MEAVKVGGGGLEGAAKDARCGAIKLFHQRLTVLLLYDETIVDAQDWNVQFRQSSDHCIGNLAVDVHKSNALISKQTLFQMRMFLDEQVNSVRQFCVGEMDLGAV